MKGIDVSHYQGVIDWAKVKAAGCEFGMIKATFGWDNDNQIDPKMVANIAGCEAAGLPYGFYHYSYAESPEDAAKEAAFFLRHIAPYKPAMPVAFDFEEAFQVGGVKNGKTYAGFSLELQLSIIEAFLGEIEKAGYFGMLYMSKSSLQRLYDYAPSRIKKFAVWVAHVDVSATSYTGKYGIWQYSWKGSVQGVSVPVDMNCCYVDYPSIIKSAGLNGHSSSSAPADTTDYKLMYEAEKAAHKATQAKLNALRAGLAALMEK
ncbi:MAG TPA: glycoside hydrolase family 25 protein [Clostridia bacterium]|nr:glycoside hydrolase family 25 protein [Clostridia bacterium]